MSDAIKQDESWMREALKLADYAESLGEVPVGAVVVLDGEVIGRGWNQPITGHDPTAHAEIIALRDAAERLENYRMPRAELFVTIEPCTMCAGAIVHSRVSRVVYGATEEKSGAVTSNCSLFSQPWLNHKVELAAGVLAQECSEKISNFFRRRREEKKAAKRSAS